MTEQPDDRFLRLPIPKPSKHGNSPQSERKSAVSPGEVTAYRSRHPGATRTEAVNALFRAKTTGKAGVSFQAGKQDWEGTKRAQKRVKAGQRAYQNRKADNVLRELSYKQQLPDGTWVEMSRSQQRYEEQIVQPRGVPINVRKGGGKRTKTVKPRSYYRADK